MGSDEIAALMQRQGSPLAGLEFKQTLPVIKDSDLDFDRHLREFRSIVDCYALNRKEGIRPYDLLVVFRRTLAAASTRIKIYDSAIAQAQNDRQSVASPGTSHLRRDLGEDEERAPGEQADQADSYRE